jgi:hypothetical protein
MKRMIFTSSVPSHVYTDLHLLKRMCRLHLVGVQWCLINKKDDFHLVVAQSYARRSSPS